MIICQYIAIHSKRNRFCFSSMYLLYIDSVLHDMLNNKNYIYKFLESISQYTNHSKAMKILWGCYNMGSYCYVIQMLLMSRVLPGGTESHSSIQGWHSKCYHSVDLSSVMPPRHQSSWSQRNRLGKQLMSCYVQLRIYTCHLNCWWSLIASSINVRQLPAT